MLSGLLQHPKNESALRGKEVQFACTTNYGPVDWIFVRLGSHEEEKIVESDEVVQIFQSKATVAKNGDLYQLFVSNVERTDAGTYSCVDNGGLGSRGSAELTVIGKTTIHVFFTSSISRRSVRPIYVYQV